MYKFSLGFVLGILIILAISDIFPKGSRPFNNGMTYCKDNPTVCDKHYESVLLKRQSEKAGEEARKLLKDS